MAGTLTLQAQTWTNTSLTGEARASALVATMTFGEKTLLLNGAGGAYVGNIPANSRLGIPALNLQDGPAGVRNTVANDTTAWPAPITLAATWDVSLARQYGLFMGQEFAGKGIGVALGPMMNVARAYQAGRNFEGSGEDPQLAAALVSAEVQGLQSQGVIATAKHFVCNDQETDRTLVTSDVDERSRQEIYYPAFRAAVRAGAGAFMASYNRVNGRYACEQEALRATVKKLWGFDGFIMSDWGAGLSAAAGALNGLDMQMYCGSQFASNSLSPLVQSGQVASSDIDEMATRILATMFRAGLFDHAAAGNLYSSVTNAAHNQFARDAAAQGMVLLTNGGNLLPLNPASVHSIAVIGSAASTATIATGGGSASVSLPYNISPLTGITTRAGAGITIRYTQGDGGNISSAVSLAQSSDVAVVCVGQQTSEGSDRSSLSLPNDQDALVNAVAAANPRTVVVLYCSSATFMPWAGQVPAALVVWYPGQENGNALASVLFGDVNPSGKLPVTFPTSTNQMPVTTAAQFPGVKGHVAYSEGLQVGYRWFDARNVAPLYPFGHGLSYTTFGYSNLVVGAISPAGQARVEFDLNNTGARAGAEVAQLYLGCPAAATEPPKQLKAFRKVFLSAGKTQHVVFTLGWEDLAYWDATARGWLVAPGAYQVFVSASSRDVRLAGAFSVSGSIPSSDLASAALHKSAVASSSLATNTGAAAALDGNTASGWNSLGSGTEWLSVDLGMTRDLSRVRLQWNTNYAAAYAIQFSPDNSTWTNAYATTQGAGGIEDILLSGKTRYVRMQATAPAVAGAGYSLAEFEVYSQPQRPFNGTVHALPGRIEAEDYDVGGGGVAYFNTTSGNSGGVYRSDDIGIEATTDTGGGYDVGWINSGEWLEYTVNAPDPSAVYNLSVRVASSSTGGRLRVRLDGTVLGTLAIPATGGWQNWQTVVLTNVLVSGGPASKALRLEMLTGGFNLNWVGLDRVQICGTNNLALTSSVTASSLESSSYSAANACDGDPRTRWSSQFSDPQWITVDLGSTRSIARVRLNWETAYAQSYRIQISTDNSAWTDLYATTNGIGSVNDLAVLSSGRYVRTYATQRGTQYGYSLYDFEVYPAQIPGLSIVPAGPNVILSWPATAALWGLYTAPGLDPTSQWSVATNIPALGNSQSFVTDAVSPGSRFYRLRGF
jgi:beta-glucosidase